MITVNTLQRLANLTCAATITDSVSVLEYVILTAYLRKETAKRESECIARGWKRRG